MSLLCHPLVSFAAAVRNIVGTKGGPTDVVIEDTVRRYFKGAVDRVSNGREKKETASGTKEEWS